MSLIDSYVFTWYIHSCCKVASLHVLRNDGLERLGAGAADVTGGDDGVGDARLSVEVTERHLSGSTSGLQVNAVAQERAARHVGHVGGGGRVRHLAEDLGLAEEDSHGGGVGRGVDETDQGVVDRRGIKRVGGDKELGGRTEGYSEGDQREIKNVESVPVTV